MKRNITDYIDKLTEEERLLIKKYGKFYRSLETGERSPTTKDQKHFIEVCQGHAQPKTEHEIAYSKFIGIYALKNNDKILKDKKSDWETEREIAYAYNKNKLSEKEKKSNKRYKVKKPKKLTKEQLRLIKSNHNYKPRTPLEIQEFRNRTIENEEYIRKKDFERNIDAMQFDNSNKKCKICGASMVWRERKSIYPTKYFLGCSRYPRCKYVESGSW